MLVQIPKILREDELATIHDRLEKAVWVDGRATTGHQSAKVKKNLQLAEDSTQARELGAIVMRALDRSAIFVSASLPRHVSPPMFNKYEAGMTFGAHVDNAIRQIGLSPARMRTDIAATLFLSKPDEYDGGELLIEDTYGAHSVKLPAGDMVLYPATSLHRVTPVTRGARIASFFWIQSLVAEDSERSLLFDLDRAIIDVGKSMPADSSVAVRLTATYHNLVRKWARP